MFIVLLLCWHYGQSEAAVGNMTYHDVHDIIKIRCCPADDCFPSQPEVASLNEKLKGRVIVPHMEEYAKQSSMYNTVEQRYFKLVICRSPEAEWLCCYPNSMSYSLFLPLV